ncbi:MAG: type II toxin-antitoxin system VapC family toxin [Nitrospirae bacterium]|nr:type II toxin-antitoxin system VapC family toxin [Nitrospirota bacterium]
MKNVLIDTDILINFLRGREKSKEFLSSVIDDAAVYCSAITIAEIFAGMKEHEREKTEELLDSLNILDVNRVIAEKAGRYKNSIKSQSMELDDCIVAATAFAKQAVLATGNGKHYPMMDIEKVIITSE